MDDLDEVAEDLERLFAWIEIIGETIGAKKEYFRNEAITAEVSALPPPGSLMRVNRILVNSLRLYCFRVNDSVVFLFNGGVKTQINAKNCPNVGPYIRQANRITQKVHQLFSNREICWNNNITDIVYTAGLEIEI